VEHLDVHPDLLTDHRLPFQTGSSALPSRSGRLRFDSANPGGALNPAQEVVYFSKFRTDYYYLFVYTGYWTSRGDEERAATYRARLTELQSTASQPLGASPE
jgi:hypothetical protein